MRFQGEVTRAKLATQWDALVIGGGLAGATLATLLARAGRTVAVVEKSSFMHHKVCGEFLSAEAVLYLERLGVDLHALGAVPIHGIRLAAKALIAEAALPFPALSITRRTLDEALLAGSAQAGAQVFRGCRVDSLTCIGPGGAGTGWEVRCGGGETLCGSTAFVATGKHDLAGRPRPSGGQNDLVAFKMYFRLGAAQHAALGGHVELSVFPGGYGGMQPVEGGLANFCLLVTQGQLKKCGGRWVTLLDHVQSSSGFLARRLEGAEPQLAKPLALSSIPYGFLCRHSGDGLWRLGDQAAVIPSFSGDGMSIALHSAHLAASLYLNGRGAEVFQNRMYGELRRQVRFASVLSRLLVAAPSLAQGARIWPGLLPRVATDTRVPHEALLRGGVLQNYSA